MMLLAVMLFCGAPAMAQTAAPAVKPPTVVTVKLQNGMTALIMQNKISPVISFDMFIRAGDVDSPSAKTGIAHMLEHMIFKGTKTIGTSNYAGEKPLLDKMDNIAVLINKEKAKEQPDTKTLTDLNAKLSALETEAGKYVVTNELQKAYTAMGAVGLNASTNNDYTNYIVSLPANRLEAWMIIESDRMQNPVFREFYKERSVVLEEMRRAKNRPDNALWTALLGTAFISHPYRTPVIGWTSDVESLTRPDAEAFYKSLYAPANATVAIVGDVDPAKTAALLKKYFGRIPARPVIYPSHTKEEIQKGERRTAVVFDAEPELLIAYKKAARSDLHYDAVVELISGILSSGRTSRFYKTLVQDKQLALDADTYDNEPGERFPSLFVLSAQPKAPHTVAELEAALYAEVDKLKTEPVTQWELDKLRNQLVSGLLQGMESNYGMAWTLGYNQTINGDWSRNWKLLDELAKVTPQEIMDTAKQLFVRDTRTVAWIEKPAK